MKKEHIDFRKEFEEFKKELENSKPIFDDDSIEFNDFDNLISNDDELNQLEGLEESNDQAILSKDYPKIALETDDILMNLTIKKDYSSIEDLDKRKEEFIKDLKEFIDEFESTEESSQLMKYYD
ncbi:MAG: hypothetical protein J6O99_06045 [Methanobrevibacter sp.]|nr:hypothetical protein [Methanobrevibacter sp.]MBO6105439.1 hypothetical protein [Methanobrevibacter sp.]MBO7211476.1 hypothetical protein [Methanobrevibacter sp.]MBO7240889.1 hypothetical protein [Methanobrevibacter sp.]MBO7443486.1 hypothetical protein [Methanobrevibacter sp.]